jgi:hypothetical protein
MNVVEIADELGITTAAALDLCARAGIPGADRSTELTPEQVAAVRAAATAPAGPLPPPPGGAPPPTPGAPPGFTAPGGPPAYGAPAPPPPGYGPPPPAPPGYGPPQYAPPGYGAPGYGPPGYGPPSTPAYLGGPPPKKSATRKVVLVVALVIGIPVLLIVALAVLGTATSSERTQADDIDDDGGFGGRPPLTDQLAVGECFEMPTGAMVFEIDSVPCLDPHDVEVFATVEHPAAPDAPAPDDAALSATALELCSPHYEDFIGAPYPSGTIDVYILYPPSLAWTALDERTIVCGATDVEGPTTGSLEGAGA